MRNVVMARPTLGFIVATRAALGVGVGLLIADRLSDSQRRRAGRALVAIGALTTIPAAVLALRGLRRGRRAAELPSWRRERILPPRRRRQVIPEME